MQKVYVKDLKIGDKILKFDRSWLSTDFLSHKFVVRDSSVLNKLVSNGIEFVYIEPREEPEEIIKSFIQETLETRAEAQSQPSGLINLSEFKDAHSIYAESVKIVKNVLTDVRSGAMFNTAAVKNVAESITTVTLKNRGVMASVAKLRSYDDYTFQHSMNVSVYCASLAAHLGMNENEVRIAAEAGLLHDVGKMMIPEHILNKPGKLTAEEYEMVKQHPVLGYEYLKDKDIAEPQLRMILEHHERSDGSGYPYGLRDHEISIFGKICAVVDIYDAITSDRSYHKAMQSTTALKQMFQWSDSQINKSVFEFFIKNIGIYPVGSVIMLSTYEIAVVGKINNNRPIEPVVIVFMNKKGEQIPIKIIDLSKSDIHQRRIAGLVNTETITIPRDIDRYIDSMNTIH